MAQSSGFYNSVDGDRVYDANDFSTYLDGIVNEGCFPKPDGLAVIANTDPIGANPPSVIIKAGKAYKQGRWFKNDADIVFSLGSTQLVASNQKHLVYLVFDLSEGVRAASFGHMSGTTVVLPADTATKLYLPLAIVEDQKNVQPTQLHITDTRYFAGLPDLVDFRPTKLITRKFINEPVLSSTGNKYTTNGLWVPLETGKGIFYPAPEGVSKVLAFTFRTPAWVTEALISSLISLDTNFDDTLFSIRLELASGTSYIPSADRVAIDGSERDYRVPLIYDGTLNPVNGKWPTNLNTVSKTGILLPNTDYVVIAMIKTYSDTVLGYTIVDQIKSNAAVQLFPAGE